MLNVNIDKNAEENTNKILDKLSSENLYPLKFDLKFSIIDFIDMEKFNSKMISAKNYDEELRNYLKENSTITREFLKEMTELLQGKKNICLISSSASSSKFNDNSLKSETLAMLLKDLKDSLLNICKEDEE